MQTIFQDHNIEQGTEVTVFFASEVGYRVTLRDVDSGRIVATVSRNSRVAALEYAAVVLAGNVLPGDYATI